MARRAAKVGELGPQRWYELEDDRMAHEVTSIAEALWSNQSSRRARYLRNQNLFEGCSLNSYDAAGYYTSEMLSVSTEDPLGLIRSAIQTGAAEIFAKQKPKPQFQTSGADWKTRRKAQKQDKACEAILNQRQGRFIDVWAFMADAGVECLTQGTACISADADLDEEKIEHELVPCCEIYVDPSEGRDPQNWFRISPIDVDKAISLFCHVEGDEQGNMRRRRAIEGATDFDRQIGKTVQRPRAIKRVKLIRAWRLPFSKKKPGKVALVIGGELMASDEWEAPAPPFVFLHWELHRAGVWGSGIADQAELARKAGELENRLFARAQVASGKRTYYIKDSIDPLALELNEPEVAIPVTQGMTMPQESVVPAFQSSELEYLLTRIKWFWDSIGISEVSAAARREPGIDSGVAIRTLNDTKSGRQLPKGQNYERAFVDLGHQYMWRLREMAKKNPKFVLAWFGKTAFQELKVADLVAQPDWSITVAPASNLPNDPAGRQAMLGEIFAQKLISPQTYKQLLGWADLDQELQSESAEYEYIDDLIDRYLDAEEDDWEMGDYESPEGMLLDKPRAIMRFSAAYFRAKQQKAPSFNVGLLRNYILDLDKQIKDAQAAQAAAAAPAALTQQGANLGGAPAPVQPMAA